MISGVGPGRGGVAVALLIVDRLHFWRLLDETPDLTRRILTILSRRVRHLEQTVQAILRGTNPA